MAKKKAASGVVEFRGGPVLKTNRFFIVLKSYGHCDENGRTVLGVECSTKKLTAPPDRPLAFMSVLVDKLLPVMKYSSDEAAEKDLEQFKKYVADLFLTQS